MITASFIEWFFLGNVEEVSQIWYAIEIGEDDQLEVIDWFL